MYNTNNNMNPLFSLLGLSGGGQGGGQQSSEPKQSGGGGSEGMDQNNPLIQLLTAMMSGQNAINALTNILPQAAQIMNARGAQNIEQFVRNEYNNRGVDINAAMQQLQQLMNNMNAGGYNTQNAQNGNYNANNGGYNANNGSNTNNNFERMN